MGGCAGANDHVARCEGGGRNGDVVPVGVRDYDVGERVGVNVGGEGVGLEGSWGGLGFEVCM